MTNPSIQRYLSDWRQRMSSSVSCFDNFEETMSTPEISEGAVSRNMKFIGYEYLCTNPNCTFEEFESSMLSAESPVERHVNHLKNWHTWKINFFHRVFLEAYLMYQVINSSPQIFYGSDRPITDKDTEDSHLLNSPALRDMVPPGVVAVKLPDYVAAGYFCAVFFVPGFPPIGLGRRGVVILEFTSLVSMRSTAYSVKIALPTFNHAIAYVYRTIKELYA